MSQQNKSMKTICLLICLFVPSLAYAETIQIFGDLLLSRGIQDAIDHEGVNSLWKGVPAIFSLDAIRVANLEGAVGEKAACDGKKLCFHIGKQALEGLDPFNVIGLSNNHALDLGVSGRNDTIKELKKRDIIPLGGSQYSTILIAENGLIGIVASTDVLNSPDDEKHMIMADSEQLIKEIRWLRRETGLVLVYVHWGRELDQLPTSRMRQLAKNYIDAGADLVVGHHPHVVGKAECIDGHPVVYSLGNFLFDQKYEETKKGAVLQCTHSNEGSLACNLIGVQTSMNSFFPVEIADDALYQKQNNILASCVSSRSPVWSGTFSKDKIRRRISIKRAKLDNALSVLEKIDYDSDKVTWNSPPMPIEKMQAIDLKGDGVSEVMLIQNIFSTLDNEVAKRVYMYSFDGGLRALWRGSGLSRPLLDATFAETSVGLTNKPVFIALHSTDSFLVRDKSKAGCILMSYRWNGFGFTGIKQKRFQINAEKISVAKNRVRLINKQGIIVSEIKIAELL